VKRKKQSPSLNHKKGQVFGRFKTPQELSDEATLAT
jgi:hypothetical protein